MSTTQETLDEYRTVEFGRPEKDCPACGETIYSTDLPEHLHDDCQGVNREVTYQ